MPVLSRWSLVALACFGVAQWVDAGWHLGKAQLAHELIAASWRRGDSSAPWPWADTRPVLLLKVEALGVERYVLDGHHGQSLAFGPGLQREPHWGTSIVAGHRDTHFAFLRELDIGALVTTTDVMGTSRQYRVVSARVYDTRSENIPLQNDALLLVTCYPFVGTSSGGPMRWVVTALPDSP